MEKIMHLETIKMRGKYHTQFNDHQHMIPDSDKTVKIST